MKHFMMTAVLVGGIFSLATVSDGATAKITMIADNRMVNLENPNQHGFQSLQLTLSLSGDDLKNPSKCGDWKLESAADDLGTNLIDPQQAFFRAGFNEVPAFNINKTDGSFTVSLMLAPAPRKATKIASLKGSVTVLAGGAPKEVKLGSPLKTAGTTLDDPALKDAGLEIVARPLPPFPGPTPVAFEVSGNTDALGKITVVTADGKPAPGNPSWNTDPRTKKMTYTYFVGSKLDDSMSVVVTVMVGQKKVIVPLDFKDVQLP